MNNQSPIEKLSSRLDKWQPTEATPIVDILMDAGLVAAITGDEIPASIRNEASGMKAAAAGDSRFRNALDEMLIVAMNRSAEKLESSRGAPLGLAVTEIQAWSTTLTYLEPPPGQPVITYLQVLTRRAAVASLDAAGAEAIEAWLEDFPIPEDDRIPAVDTILTAVDLVICEELQRIAEQHQIDTSRSQPVDQPKNPEVQILPLPDSAGKTPVKLNLESPEPISPIPIQYSREPERHFSLAARDSSADSGPPWNFRFESQELEVTITGDGKYAGIVRGDSTHQESESVISLRVDNVAFEPGEPIAESNFVEDWHAPREFELDAETAPELSITLLLPSGEFRTLRSPSETGNS